MTTVLDFAGLYPSPAAVKRAGHAGVMLYVSGSRPGSNFAGKRLTPAVLNGYMQAGVPAAPVFQFGKAGSATPSDWRGGRDAGFRDALAARGKWFDCGGPGFTPIYFAVDEDLSLDDWNRTAVHYFRGVNDAIGREWTGIYAKNDVIDWAIEDNVIGGRNGKRWAWQTRAWSGTEIHPLAVLYQRVIDTASAPGPKVDGTTVDVNDVLAADWGQTGINRAPAPAPTTQPPVAVVPATPAPATGETAMLAAPMIEEDQTGNSPNQSQRFGAKPKLFVLHTQEGNGDAQSLTNFLKNPNSQVSYHYSGDNRRCIAVVNTDNASWSVLDANGYCINYCFAGSKAAQSRDVWLNQFGKAIEMAAWLFVRDAAKYNPLEPIVRGWEELRRGLAGGTDHRGITAMGIGNHTDVGPNFPWDVFAAAVTRYASGVPIVKVVNVIEQEQKEQAAWIGAFTGTEKDCRGNKGGKYRTCANGTIYWTPSLGAHAVPARIMDVYARNDYEMGKLGYPIGDPGELKGKDGKRIGLVQGFEFGAIYRLDGQFDGFVLGGFIRELWNRSGFENGPYGMPISNEIDYPGGRYQDFVNGRIVWPKRGAVGFLNSNGLDPIVADK